MNEHRRESDGLVYKITKFWPVAVFVGGAMVAYIRMGFTVEQLAEKVKKVDPMEERMIRMEGRTENIEKLVERIDRRTERWSRGTNNN